MLRKAMRLADASTYLKFGIGFAVAGAIAGSFGISREYTSTALLRITPLQEDRLPVDIEPIAQVEQQVLSRPSLSSLIQNPALNLYPKEREQQPLEHVIERMRSRDIHVSFESDRGGPTTMRVSFQYPDQAKAQATEKLLVHNFEALFDHHRSVNEHTPQAVPIRQTLEVLDRPHLSTVTTDRWLVIGEGLLGGLMVGILAATFWKQPRRASIVGALGLAGCVVGVGLAFFLPQRYESHAALQIVTRDRLAGTKEGRDWLRRLVEKVQQPNLRTHLTDHGTTVELAFVNPDPKKAQAGLVAINARIDALSRRDSQSSGRPWHSVFVILEPASLPVTPVGPNRFFWGALIGMAAGLIGGFAKVKQGRASVPQWESLFRLR